MNRGNNMIADRYLIKTSLGEGGMADVYLAEDVILNREVAIKILRGELSKDPVTLLRFQREASAASKLNHPNVVDVYDVGEYEGHHYIVMEYVRGRTLKQLISQRGALHKEESINIMIQLTSAVQQAHEHNIIHRDIKPQNVLVKDDGTVKITDFGISLAHDAVQLTQTDAVLGSAHYLAPETTRGEAPTNQVDIYALGIVFYELLTGSVPFKGDNPVQIAMKHLHEEIPSVREFNPTLPQSIENIIIRATAKNRKLRYQSTKEMLYDLEHCLNPNMAHVKKLVFEEEQTDPTLVMEDCKPKEQKQVNSSKVEKKKENKKGKKNKKPFIYVGIGVLVLATIVILLSVFSVKESIVPKLVGLNENEAMQMLNDAKFKDIDIERKYCENVAEGIVAEVYPKEGQKVKRTHGIKLVVSKGVFYTVEDFTNPNRYYEDVEKELRTKAPNIKLVVKEVESTAYQPGVIIEQSGLDVGEKIDPQQEVKLYLTVTKRVEFMVDFVGRPVDEVKEELEAKGIYPVLDKLDIPEGEEDVEEGVVIKCNPAEGTLYKQEGGNTITLYYY